MSRPNDNNAFLTRTKHLITGCLLFYFSFAGIAQGHYLVTPDLARAYELAFELNIDAAATVLNRSATNDPNNLLNVFVADYLDFFRLFIDENADDYVLLEEHRDQRLRTLAGGDETSPYHLYTQAEIHLHWALIKFKFDEQFSAASEINRAFKLLKRNEKRFPDFAPNLKSLGMLRAGVGTIPDKYLWAVKLFSSLNGTIAGGLEDIERAMELWTDDLLHPREVHYFYAMASLHFASNPDDAWSHLLSQQWLKPDENLSDCFILGHVAMKSGRNDKAITLYQNRPVDDGLMPFAYLDFMQGVAKVYRNDTDADVLLLRFLDNFHGTNYIKEAFQKLAWHALINGEPDQYAHYMNQCLTMGTAVTDEDRHAMREAEDRTTPHPELLRARLLFDGGYYLRSLNVLDELATKDFGFDRKLELMYRRGRVLHALGRADQALDAYRQTIAVGADSKLYFPCNAALQAGLLYESRGQDTMAREMFEKCLAMRPSDYQGSLHQKAKAGRNRLKGK